MKRFVENERIMYMDIVKSFAIIAVVIGHSGSPITNIIYLFHMPLFFFISGYFYKDYYSKAPSILLKKRLRTLYKPYVEYELLFLALHNIFFKLYIYSNKVGYEDIVSHLYSTKEFAINAVKILAFDGTEQLAGAFWFIPVLFAVNLLFGVISYFTTKYIKENSEQFRFFAILLAFLIGNISTYCGFNFHYPLINFLVHYLNISLVALLIYYTGYIYRKHDDKVDINLYFVVIATLFLITSSLYGSINMVSNTYLSPSFLIVNSLAGIYVNIYLAKIIVSKNINHIILEYIGRNTFTIMAMHFLSFKLINFIQVKLYNLPIYMVAKFPIINGDNEWWILYSICGVFLPIIVKYGIDGFIQKLKYATYHFSILR
jgi:fucose 4-O-acetylase-like acetyltransferase